MLSYFQDASIHQLFEVQVEQSPDSIAIVFEGLESQQTFQSVLTYRELNIRANQLAHYLKTLGVGTEVLVGICVERSIEMIVGILGVLKAGGAYLPLDPNYPKERLAFMLEDSQVSVLLTQQRLMASLPTNTARIISLDTDWDAIAQHTPENLICEVTSDHLAYVIYTSGSTGKPKGVMITHRGICNTLYWRQNTFKLTAKDKILQTISFSFDPSVWQIFWPLSFGAQLIMAHPSGHNDPAYLIKTIVKQQITVIALVSSMMRVLLEEEGIENCQCLKHITCGGEALPIELVERFFERLKLDNVLVNCYGLTEAAIDASFWICQRGTDLIFAPIGRPITNTEIYILNEDLQPVPVGEAGELYIGGIGLARGYLNRPELTLEKFIPNPFASEAGSRLYKTGDIARYLPDGNLEFLGRIDHQVKIRGFRIELGEIEAAIAKHPVLKQALVIDREDVAGNKLVAYIVAQPEEVPTQSELRRFLQGKLPEYMVPAAFVLLETLPLMPNGKVDRRALPAPASGNEAVSIVPPRNQVEAQLVEIWQQVLGMQPIGVTDNFFELGGQSLLVIQVVSRIRDRYQVDLPMRSLFDSPTIAQLAQKIESSQEKPSLQAPPIVPIPRNQKLPLAFSQQRLWFFEQLVPGKAIFNDAADIRLPGLQDVAALEESLNEIIRRHEIWRTTFEIVDGQAVQVIHPAPYIPLPVVDLQALPAVERETEALRQTTEQAQQPFDLTKLPLIRAILFKFNDTDYRLYLIMHHLIFDGYSLGNVFLPELAVLYEAFSQGKPAPLPELSIQFADYAYWQRQWLQDEVLAPQLDYWKKQLANLSMLQLPTDRPRPAMETFRGARHSVIIPKNLTDELRALRSREGVTLFMTLLAAFKTVLARHSQQDDIPVGAIISAMNRPELTGLIGLIINNLVLRTDLADNPSFTELLERVRKVTLDASANQDIPFQKLVEALRPERHLGHQPLFQVMFILNPPTPVLESGWNLHPLILNTGTSNMDLMLSLDEQSEGLVGYFEYNSDLFDAATITRMVGHFQTVLAAVVTNPAQKISELPLLTEAEKQQLQVGNDTQTDYSLNLCLHELFAAQVERSPDAVAVVYENEQLTYKELNARANQLAHYLQKQGVGTEVLVGIFVERSLYTIIGILGILKAGGAYVPLDPSYPQERLAFILQDSQVSVLLTQQHLTENLSKHQTRVVCLDADWEVIANESQENLISDCTPDNLAYIIYTSGSTGQPKGVLVNHGNVVRLFTATESWYHFNQQDVWTLFHSIAFDFSVWEMWGALLYGGKLVVVPYWLSRSPADFYKFLLAQQVTVLNQTPSAFGQLVQAEKALGVDHTLSLRLVIFGGEALELQSLKPWFEKHGDQIPQLVNMYGITETTVHVTYRPLTIADLEGGLRSVIGRTIPDLQLYLLDRYQQPVPIGVTGEMYIGGAGVARGYLNRPELTNEKFIPNPFSKILHARLYRSGDLARYLPNGDIEYLGRIDHQVKIRGFRIEVGEIEAVLSKYTDVQEAIVVVREDVPGDQRLVAYIVTSHYSERVPNQVITRNLRNFLKQKLPEYMVPNSFILLDTLPLTPSGKVDRKALQQYSPTVASDTTPELEAEFAAPRNAIEQTIAGVWTEVLRCDRIGIRDHFFDLGGHSLLATQVISRLRELFRVELSLRLMFESPSVAELAEAIAQLQSTPATAPELAITSVSRAAYRMKRSALNKGTDGLDSQR